MKIYKDGKIDPTDEGQLRIATYTKNNKLVVDFGKDISWIGFDKKSLLAFIENLKEYTHKIK